MALIRWNPARELNGLQTDVNRLFDAFFQGSPTQSQNRSLRAARWIPAMDISENGDALILRLDLPGLRQEDVAIEAQERSLTIKGERHSEQTSNEEGYYRVERSFGEFARTVELPEGVDANTISAAFDNGVLEVRIPKPEEQKPQKIEIGSSKEQPALTT